MTETRTASAPTGDRKYWAFISYSHADEAWARWVHRSLEKYRVPRRLVGRSHTFGKIPARLRPIFRDRDEMASSPELSAALHEALAGSRELIVICSPAAAASPYVNEEVRRFQSLGRGDRIRCLIVDGQPSVGGLDCFPAALRSSGGGSEDTNPVEPLAADVRRGMDGRSRALLKILAGMLDVPYDELRRREQRRNRQRWTIAVVSVAALLVSLLVVLSDAGLKFPYGEEIRVRLDRAGISLFRPVLKLPLIVEAAARLRPRLIATLGERRRDGGMYSWSPNRDEAVDTWSSAQVIAVLSATPETTPSDWPRLRQTIDKLFSEPYLSHTGGRPSGWIFRAGRPPNGNVSLWAVSSLAEVVSSGLVPDAERPAIIAYYTTALQVASQLSPLDDGGWNMFAAQDDPGDHNYYTGLLALQAMIGAHTAGLPWAHGQPALPRAAQTARWLVRGFEGGARTAGWRRSARDKDAVLDGLTLQAYALLLRAEELGAIVLPDNLVVHMTRSLVSLVDRDQGNPSTAAEFNATVNGTEESEGIVLLWYPWAIRAADLWLRRADRLGGAAAEDVTRVRRSLGHLIVNCGEGFVATHEQEETFRAAELLWNLTRLER